MTRLIWAGSFFGYAKTDGAVAVDKFDPETECDARDPSKCIKAVPKGRGVEVCRKGLVVTSSRVVAIADIHGDWKQFEQALLTGSLVDPQDPYKWIGGDAVLVQTGDVLDRGPDSLRIFQILEHLRPQARKAGGCIVQTLGNHELMNLVDDLRYADAAETAQFGGLPMRRAAMLPDHWLGAYLRNLPLAISIVQKSPENDFNFTTIACHAGIGPRVVKEYSSVEQINGVVERLFKDADMHTMQRLAYRHTLLLGQGPLWTRIYADENDQRACGQLSQVLGVLGAQRMIVGHTVQITGRPTIRCGGRLIMADTGMSSFYGGGLSLVELRSDGTVEREFKLAYF